MSSETDNMSTAATPDDKPGDSGGSGAGGKFAPTAEQVENASS
jgi:hypothetical protein